EWGEEVFAGVGVSWTFFDFGRSSSRGAAFVAEADRLRALRAGMEDSLRAVSRVESRRLRRALGEVEDARANV
ncbi:MAG: hypothetical protein GWM92_04035, partial [Gemmatimonadetes bacterium]|nr:hypothetical protein [Gemmatimonadota bacterium]NIR78248.1 hypothetical protein [Gemmatimonadota bacterium]NIT86257.1 hypothetical protein [Gemmatimonadota bacterium]NIU33297.1 hypothetical protein [Gemmatimonadota bacterium]NIU37591.1 hypothetical protein [Gemmatimonadota bacterium]